MARLLVQLISLALGHGCVDGCATMINPLIRARVETFGMSVESIAWMATIVMTITCSFSQPLMALWSDRWGARWFALMAPFTAAAGMAAAIDTTSPVWMAVWLGACGVSVAVYHPIPAAMVGDIWPNRRTLALAIFLGGGMIGLGIGPIAVSYILEHLDSDGGWWFLIVAAPITIALLASCGPARHLGGESQSLRSLLQALRGRRGEMAILVAIASIRALATMGLSLGITLLTDRQHTSLTWTGWLLSAFLFSGGVTGLASGLFFHPRARAGRARRDVVAGLRGGGFDADGGSDVDAGLLDHRGVGAQGVNPIIVAMSQRILPSGSRMASSLVMGWSWGVGGLLGLVVTMIDPIEWAFVGVGLTLLPAAALTLKLPVVPTSSGVVSDA